MVAARAAVIGCPVGEILVCEQRSAITGHTCVSQVARLGWASVLLGNNVVGFAPEKGIIDVNQAVLAA